MFRLCFLSLRSGTSLPILLKSVMTRVQILDALSPWRKVGHEAKRPTPLSGAPSANVRIISENASKTLKF